MPKKILFIDRDGTLLCEPDDFQIDDITKFELLPHTISSLALIKQWTDYEFVMVTNQDGLGTSSFPENTFTPCQQTLLNVLASEGIVFADIHIDKSFPHENAPTRKPNIGMLHHYLNNPEYDIENSIVIGDRLTDVILAKNLKCKAILITQPNRTLPEITDAFLDNIVILKTNNWQHIAHKISLPFRQITHQRKTAETDIAININLDGSGKLNISTGLHFFNHMLDQLGKHSGIDLSIIVKGDLHIDEHHTIEDTAIALGEALAIALKNKLGIQRYGFCLPMDEAEAHVSLDFGGRAWLIWDAEFKREKIGDMPTEMFYHFFKSLSDAAKMNLHIAVKGDNEHHKIEAIFKALAYSIKTAINQNIYKMILPSTKGML